jgi:hypothetical protein
MGKKMNENEVEVVAGAKVLYAGERAVVMEVGRDARGFPMAVIRLAGRKECVVYHSQLDEPNW